MADGLVRGGRWRRKTTPRGPRRSARGHRPSPRRRRDRRCRHETPARREPIPPCPGRESPCPVSGESGYPRAATTTPTCGSLRNRTRRSRRAPVAAAISSSAEASVQHRQDDLRFRIAEPHIELDHLRAVRRQHQTHVEETRKRRALRAPCRRSPARPPDRRPGARGPASEADWAQRRPCRRCSDPGRRRRSACGPAPTTWARRSGRRTGRR